jgi:hypothetical protein
MRLTILLASAVLVLGSGCSSTLTGADGGGATCSGDTDCRTGQYCMGFSQQCATGLADYTVGVGICHRDCSAGACSCAYDADCRAGAVCSSGRCVGLPINCAEEPSSCPVGCTLDPPSDRSCGPVCRCGTCPVPVDASGQGGNSGLGGSSGSGGNQGTDAGMTCSPACTSGFICIASGTEGGAIINANDAGLCPSGTHPAGLENRCDNNLAYGCMPIPAG